jgi:hypothetical protein
MTEKVHVILKRQYQAADKAAVAEVFASVGIPADVEGQPKSLHEVGSLNLPFDPWLIEIGKSARYLGAAVAGGLISAPGADAWMALKRMVGRLYEARGRRGNVVLKDPDTNLEIRLEPDLPDEAYQRLLEIESPQAPIWGILWWDRQRRQWVDMPWHPLPSLAVRCRYPGCTKLATEHRVRQLSPTTVKHRDFCEPHAAATDLGDDHAWD